MKTVIYARYSNGANQTEQSIEGQLRECYEFAKIHNLTIVDTYIDRAISGTTDHREQLQKMIQDSDRHLFDAILMYKLDRFARNRYDSAMYKARLKKNGVKIYYAKESIPEGPEGIILESMLEGMAEYYSAELSQKIKRGMKENAYNCRATGGNTALGYRVAPDKTFVVDEAQAILVNKIYNLYDQGKNITEICDELNASGARTARNAKFNKNSLRTILQNKKYIGIYESQGICVEGGIPAIVDKELFDRVQERRKANAKAPGKYKARVDYLLSGKLYCGLCGARMTGECGTSTSKIKYYYYICSKKKVNHTCKNKRIPKDYLENLVVEETCRHILQPDIIQTIAKKCVAIAKREQYDFSELKLLQHQLSEVEHKIDNLVAAIEKGIYTSSTKSRLEDLEQAKDKLEFDIELAKIKKPDLTEEHIIFMLNQFCRETSIPMQKYNEDIIECFVHAVYFSKDRLVITYNLTNEKNELDSSFLSFLMSNDDNSSVSSRYFDCSLLDCCGGGEEN